MVSSCAGHDDENDTMGAGGWHTALSGTRYLSNARQLPGARSHKAVRNKNKTPPAVMLRTIRDMLAYK